MWYISYMFKGERIRESISKLKSEAEAALAARKSDILRGRFKFQKTKKIRFKDYADEYLDSAKTIKKRSWPRDEASLKNLKSHFGEMFLSDISYKEIEAYKKKRIETVRITKKGEKKPKPATINRELACLKTLFNEAIRSDMVAENPVREVKSFQEQKKDLRIPKKDELDRLAKNSCSHLKDILVVALNTGMRRDEILNLRWNDVDFIDDFMFIKETKSGVPRKVPMNDMVRSTLKKIERGNDFIFYNPKTNTRFKDIKTAFNAACRRANIVDLTFHDLRHVAATNMVMGGVDLVTVKEILGHASIVTTLRYAHPTPENKRRAENILAAFYRGEETEKDTPVLPHGQTDLNYDQIVTPPVSKN